MTELEKALLDEVETLQTEILRLQDEILSKQKENDELLSEIESLQSKSIKLYYSDLEQSLTQDFSNILSSHKNEQTQIEVIKTELNQHLEALKSDSIIADYHKLESEYKTLQKDYETLKTKYLMLKIEAEQDKEQSLEHIKTWQKALEATLMSELSDLETLIKKK
ncbi:hypothetical protein EII32_11415 [Prevotella sp. OH937_COT-195]|nr:hypothetical protein EII32_11415 [Prevotella sp. OH937_COT-195]